MTEQLVQAFHPGPAIQGSAQGQDLTPIFWGGPDGNMPGSENCGVRIVMRPGKVSTPHVHHVTQVQVTLDSGWYGVLTLYGDTLEHHRWVRPGGTLVIRPGVPHVALYPHRRPDNDDRIVVEAIATEIRNNPDWRADVEPLPDLWFHAYRQADTLGLAHLFDFPPRKDWR
jgi:quercetin dioxygenase-like cupin family protein